MTNGNDLNIPLTESADPIDENNAFSEYSLTRKSWKSQTLGKLRTWINKVPAGGVAGQLLRKKSAADYDLEFVDAPEDELPAGGTAGQVLAKKSTTDGDVEWRDEVPASATDIDARIADWAETGNTDAIPSAKVSPALDAAIPAKRRLPDFGAESALQTARVNASGTALEYAAAAAAGANDELTTRASLPATGGFSDGDLINVGGVLYELVADTEDPNIYRGVIAANAAGDTGYYGDMTFRFQPTSPFNMRANFSKAGLVTAPANLYVKYHSGSEYADIVLNRASGRDTSATWGYVHAPGTPGLETPEIGADFDLSVFSDTAYSTAQTIHTASRWEKDDRNDPDVNPIALGGNTDRWPKTKLPSDTAYQADLPSRVPGITLLERTPGLTLTSTTSDFNVGNAPYYWSNPGIDLDDHPHGEFHCSLELTILPTSDVNMGFVQGKANQLGADRQVALSNVIFASDIAELSDYVVSTNIQTLNGLNVFRQTVYSGSTIVGHYTIIFVHNANNEVGYHVFWDGQAGGTGATFNAELRVTFTPSDAPTIPAKNSRGALQATSSILPTTGLVNGQVISGVSWTLPMGSGLTVDGVTLTEAAMRVVPGQIGWWVVVEVNGVETYEALDPMNNSGTIIIRAGQSDAKFLFQTTSVNKWRLAGGNSPTLPSNTRVKIYLAVT